MRLGESRKQPDRFCWQHLLAWLGGILCALVPFMGSWELGTMQVPVRNGPGYFGVNVLIACGLCFLGGGIGGYWWRFCKWMLGENDMPLTLTSVVLFILGVAGWVVDGIKDWYLYQVGAVLVIGMILAFMWRTNSRRRLKLFSQWLRERRAWNALFFGLMFIILCVCSVVLTLGMEIEVAEKVSVIAGRIFTSLVLMGGLYMLGELMMRGTPKYFRWAPWLVIGLVPMAVLADLWMRLALGRRLMEFVNGLTASGEFNLMVELAASGLDVSPLGALAIAFCIPGAALLVAWVCWKLSARSSLKVSMGTVLAVSFVGWLCVVAEQGLGAEWKNVSSWQKERKIFALHLGVFSPPEGVGKYWIEFHDPGDGSLPSGDFVLAKKPDIYVFMVESMRADAVREDSTPFLWWLMNEECQPLGSTWAGSNATHLSWFNFFHSQVPVYWRGTLEGIEDRATYAGAPPLQLLNRLGYDIQVRAVCDLNYKDFGLLNFGGGKTLASVVIDDSEGSTHFKGMNIPEREVKTFAALREAVQENREARLFFTALDSPHYNYYWHRDFTPPFKDYAEVVNFPFNPDAQEVRRYLRRYWNSCAWIDHQIEEFCKFLKAEGRYDDSIIMITGDHGEEFQERGGWCHCSSLQPEQTKVPILIKWPKSMGRGPEHQVASHMDVMPTLLAALGVPDRLSPKMTGVNLLRHQGSLTAISTTAYAGKDGEAMIWRNADHTAIFSWSNYWDAKVPEQVVLEKIIGPDGELVRADAEEYLDALKEIFPDAFARYIKSLEVVEN